MPSWIRLALLVWAVVALSIGSAAGGPAGGPPFAAGTTWTYQVAMTKDGQTQTGTSTETYRGMAAHRGTRYHVVEQAYSFMPGFAQRAYLVWDGRRFRQAVTVETDGKSTAEILFDKSIPLGARDDSSGTATIVLNGAQQGTVPWSFTSTSPGRRAVTVPAGSFQAVRWDAVLKLGTLESRFTIDVVGITDVRVEATQAVGGTPMVTIVKELSRGPIR
jgi:hypothetical protein